jgi:hypothetical protein
MLLQRHQGLTLTRTRSGGAHQPHPLGAVAKLQSGQPSSLNRLNNDIQASPSTSRWVQCHSTSHSHAARSSGESTQTNFDNGVILVFKKWARTLSLLGALAAWSYLSYGNTNSPFASMSLSIPSTSSAGEIFTIIFNLEQWAYHPPPEQVQQRSQQRVGGQGS